MSKKISFIVVNYNGYKWLPRFFETILAQSYSNFEVIVVDNASSDNSINYINSLNDKRIKIIELEDNKGFASANNIGIKNASTEYICLINNDVWVKEDFLEKLASFYFINNYDVVAPNEATYDELIKFNRSYTIDLLGHCVWIDEPINQKNNFYLQGICLFFKKDLYLETGGLDDDFFMYFEETDWFWRLNLYGKTFSYIPGLFIFHKGSGTTGRGIGINSFLWRNQNTLQMLLKNYSFVSLLILLPFYILQNILEAFIFLILGKADISKTYVDGYIFNFNNLKKTLQKRKEIQRSRKLSDFKLVTKFYKFPGKLKHLLEYIKVS